MNNLSGASSLLANVLKMSSHIPRSAHRVQDFPLFALDRCQPLVGLLARLFGYRPA
jgi:hypothetical protein